MTVVGINFLSTDVFRGLVIILLAVYLTVVGSSYQWITPKNRSKFWLLFPAIFSAFGYVALMRLRERKIISSRIEERLTSIVASITKYYLELKRNYHNRFNDEASLIAAAGVLAAYSNIGQRDSFVDAKSSIEQKIGVEQILENAKKSVPVNDEGLVDFIINIGIKIFHIGNPEFSISEVTEECIEKRRDIESIVQKIKSEHRLETDIASAVSMFIISFPFKSLRDTLGIND